RYHPVYLELKRLMDEKAIGELLSFDQLEAVDPIDYSHSYVRGNWGNQSRSAFMLMTKSCHDIDILTYLVGKKCRRVSSFGSLAYFRKENAPENVPKRCSEDCPIEFSCPYSISKVYCNPSSPWKRHLERLGSPVSRGEEKRAILEASPFGRCVYHCDNDVVDHQVVCFEFENHVTGTFTMTAFAAPSGRSIRLHGTQGWIRAKLENNEIDIVRFQDNAQISYKIPCKEGSQRAAD
ncbi:MAG: Gfo/Idh/MocA family oxidoreductase, partial [Verrucomicrobiota bacterium]